MYISIKLDSTGGYNMKKNVFHIKEIVHLTKLEKSTIRYWEKVGLLRLKRDYQNNYRIFDSHSLIDLMDIIFFRGLNIPVKKLKMILHKKPDSTYHALIESEKKLQQEIQQLQNKQAVIKKKKKTLEELFKLQKQGVHTSFPLNFRYVETFNYANAVHVSQYLTSPTNFVLFFSEGDSNKCHEGIIVEKKFSEQLVFEKSHQKIIFGGLLKVNNSNYTENNLNSLRQQVKLPDNTPSIAQYLASGEEDNDFIIDYYKCWFILK